MYFLRLKTYAPNEKSLHTRTRDVSQSLFLREGSFLMPKKGDFAISRLPHFLSFEQREIALYAREDVLHAEVACFFYDQPSLYIHKYRWRGVNI